MIIRVKKTFTCASILAVLMLPAASVSASTYIVAQGDTLSKISRQFQTTPNDLMSYNQLTSDKLSIGQVLQIDDGRDGTVSEGQPDIPPADPDVKQPAKQQDGLGKQARVIGDILNVREFPSLDSQIIGKLPYGTVVTVEESQPEWTKITFENKEAFVSTNFLAPVADGISLDQVSVDAGKWMELIQPLLKTRYVLGGTTPDGFDCSGFTAYVYKQLGVTLPRTSEDQFRQGEKVEYAQAKPGDLLFYDSLRKGHVSHVGIYLGNGLMAHANGNDVDIEKVEYMNKLYPFYGVKRYIQ